MTCPRCSSAQITVTERILRGTWIRICFRCDDCDKEWDEVTNPASVDQRGRAGNAHDLRK